jgi:hypothetical protein
MQWAGHVARVQKDRNAAGIWCGNQKQKKTVECLALRGENNIKIDLKWRRIEKRELD